jgi:carbohydrate-selective porin OprB
MSFGPTSADIKTWTVRLKCYGAVCALLLCSTDSRAAGVPRDSTATGSPQVATTYQQSAQIVASYTAEAAANPIGGIREGAEYAGRISLDALLPLGRHGTHGTLRMFVTSRHGQELAGSAIGNNTSVQEIYGPQKRASP